MIGNIKDLSPIKIESPLANNSTMRVLISPAEGWDGYVMRLVEVEKDGYTPKHDHPWPHINFIVDGKGELMIDEKATIVTAGSYAFVPENKIHQFRNVGDTDFKFICIVPEEGHKI